MLQASLKSATALDPPICLCICVYMSIHGSYSTIAILADVSASIVRELLRPADQQLGHNMQLRVLTAGHDSVHVPTSIAQI